MRSRDPLDSVIAPVPDHCPASGVNGPVPWAAPFSTPAGTARLTPTATAAILSETDGKKRRSSRRRAVPFREFVLSERQVEYVIEVSFPKMVKDREFRTRRRAGPIDKTAP